MVWKKVSNNQWERPLDGLEAFFVVTANMSAKLCDGREHYTLFASLNVEIDSSDVISDLRHAWRQLRYEQPQISTTIQDMKRVYTIPDEDDLDRWLNETFIVSDALNVEEMQKVIKPIKQITLYYVPKSSELVIRGHHYTIDGTGMELLCDSFLNALAHPDKDITFRDESARLAPVMEEVLGFSEPSVQAREKAEELLGSYLRNQPAIGPISKLGSVPSGKCQNAELVFSPEITDLLVKACHRKSITVTSAIHAAYVSTLMEHVDPDSEKSRYTSMNQFDLRPYLPPPYNSSKYAASVYYAPHPHIINLPASYWDLVDSFTRYYKTTFKQNPDALEMTGAFKRGMHQVVSSPEFLEAPAPKDALVSSLGIVENFINHEYGNKIKVNDFEFGTDIVLGMSMLFFYTFQGKLRLVHSFNDGFQKAEDIMVCLESIQRTLIEEFEL
ncbi:hypothetical protein FLAG1_04272 [Fusarium langsethiae]|uniref:Condensation domain-containing protein n=1 Tax=Fusarium langsethiae TaxID=179993 RepID=A0A0M9EZE4_FUSLA|nr:hypothetical protein FLAG1_04272 [Fusarium langsethiae]GKU03637.1 unnamed protein product [Fusarium langsethiae]GKU19133.1 unnamed protein product [Fusarium langsethiae]